MPNTTPEDRVEKMRRINIYVSPQNDRSMRVLGLDPDGNPDDGVPADGATQVTAALARYADAVARAGVEVDKILVRAEWNYLAGVLNGCANLWDWSETPMPSTLLIRANAEDAHSLNGAGDKWFGDELDAGSGDKAAKAFFAKLAKLTPIQGDAILAAVRWFWRHHAAIDHSEHMWWAVEFRAPRKGEK